MTLSGGITGAGQNLTVGSAGNTIVSGIIGTTTGTLTKEGAGILTLSGVNTYTGATTISSGQLTIDDGSIATSSGILNNAALEYKLNTNARTYSNAISGIGTLTKTGTNTLTLTGANTYTGATTVSAGTLALVGGSQASPVTVSSGASLGFTLGSPTTSTSSFNLTAGTIKITGTPTLPSYTLVTSSTGITGTPVLDAPIAGYSLVKYGNTLKLETPYGAWANGSFANAFTQTGLEDDPDGDGIKNLLEYAFGTDPTVSSAASITYSPGVVPGQPVLQKDRGIWYAVFGRRSDYLTAGLTYTVQFSSALSSWTPTVTAPTVIATGGVIEVVRVPFLDLVPGDSGPQTPTFFRVQVSQ